MQENQISFLLFAFFTSNAQTPEKVTFGFGAGVNISGVSLTSPASSVSPYSLSGFKGLVFIDAPLGKNFFLQTELAYDGLGWQFDGDDNYDGGQKSNVKTYLNYLTLAVLPKYKVENTRLAFFAGPAFGFLLSATVKGYGGETHDDINNYAIGNFGGVVGAEYYLSMGLGMSVRYTAGISNIINRPEQGESMHTHAFSVSVVYRLHRSR